MVATLKTRWWWVVTLLLGCAMMAGQINRLWPRLQTNLGLLYVSHIMWGTSARDYGQATESAEQLLRSALKPSGDNSAALRGLGFIAANQGLQGKAIDLWIRSGEDAESFMQRASNASSVEDYDEALEWYDRASAANSSLADPWYFKANVFSQLGNRKQAIDSLELAIDLPVRAQIGLADVYFQLGQLYAAAKGEDRSKMALAMYDQAITKSDFADPVTLVSVHFAKAELFRRERLTAEAIKEYDWIISNKPDHYWALLRKATLLWNGAGDAAAAEELLLGAVRVNPTQKTTYKILAEIYLDTDRPDQAVQMYVQVLALDPGDEQAKAALSEAGSNQK